jgi:hypothetical protein
MACSSCKYWNGTTYSSCADCYRILSILEPEILNCKYYDEDMETDVNLQIPFDPHNTAFWIIRSVLFCQLMGLLEGRELPDGITCEVEDGMTFYKTDRDYECELWKRR